MNWDFPEKYTKVEHSQHTNGYEIVQVLWYSNLIKMEDLQKLRDELNSAKTRIDYCTCDYCGKEIMKVRDKFCSNPWWGYLGNQARKPNVYSYSPIINLIRKIDPTCSDLYNLHARVHTKPIRDYSIICSPNSLHNLCNDCFMKTYTRIKVYAKPPYKFPDKVTYIEISVLQEKGETVESVLRDLGMNPNNFVW